MASAAPTGDPHEGIQECVSLIASLHGQTDAVLVASRVNTIGHGRVIDFLENIFGSGEPSLGPNNDESDWLIRGLQNALGIELGRCIFGHNLGILTTGQNNTLAPSTGPRATEERNPLLVAPDAGTQRHLRVQLNAHAEVELQGWGRDLQGSCDIALGESMKQVVRRDRIFHDAEIGGAF